MWYKFLMIELQEVKNFVDPNSDMTRYDKEVGTMTDDQKRLYTLVQNLSRNADELKLKAKYATSQEEVDELRKKIDELEEKANVIRKIMWVCIQDEFGLWGLRDEETVGVRRGFKIVITTRPAMNFMDFLRGGLQE